ncbi:DUF2334 domain-containing protein [Sporosarcina siberiensis]|uniref:DUF2334 domain-containing protein n=1 Tax=Sporosarcina siberiensis TaxID=1365606 RepID=A0ABW4SEI4_9BACL
MIKRGKFNMSLLLLAIIFLMCFSFPILTDAKNETEPKVLVMFTSKSGEIDENTLTVDMIVGHFTTDITIKNSQDVKKSDLVGVTHLIYYGQVAKKEMASFHHLFEGYSGHFIAIGYNSERLGERFSFVNTLHEVKVDRIFETKNKDKELTITPEYVIDIEIVKESDVLVQGKMSSQGKSTPVVVKNDKNLFIAFDELSFPKYSIIGEVLHESFQSNHEKSHPAYIRLEDIHPLVNPIKMEEITDILIQKKIPFMMAVIPVYTNPETGKEYHFSDSPKLLKVLKNAQENGGSIVLHGYTHQYRESETGEGFEFWDVDNNTPIYAEANEEFVLKKESEFATIDEYEKYTEELVAFESNYIRKRVTRGIQELTNYGLYPLAFEAPHYTMSQNGYNVLAEFFSTYVGQVQLSDKDWEVMGSAPYATNPSFLKGMHLLPETMGYIRPNDPQAVEKMLSQAEIYQYTRDGILGAFYHPYLGVNRFKDMLIEMEKLPDISWIDLKKMDVWVKVENVEISTVYGQVVTKVSRGGLLMSSMDFPAYHLQRITDKVVWIMAVVGGIAVLLFIGFTLMLSSRNMKMEG